MERSAASFHRSMLGGNSDAFFALWLAFCAAVARSEIAQALDKLRAGDTTVIERLAAADAQIRQAQEWARRFLGQKRDDAR